MPENSVLTQLEGKEIITSVFKRLMAVESYEYKSLPPIKSSIVLLKPTEVTLRSASEDYGLREVNYPFINLQNFFGLYIKSHLFLKSMPNLHHFVKVQENAYELVEFGNCS